MRPVAGVVALVTAVLVAAACSNSGAARSTEPRRAKIGFIFVGTRDDLGYNQAAWEGSEAVAKAFPDHEVLRQERVPETDSALTAMEAMVAHGAGVIFATSFGHLRYAYELARRHPDVIVVHEGGNEPTPRLDNFGTYWATVYERVYQAGIAAGAATKTGKIGFVVAFPIPATFANVNAFALGARSVRPDATTTVVFTKDWCQPELQADAAKRLLALGADVLTQHQDCTRTILQAAEAGGAATVGYHADGSEVAPRAWLVGTVWDWKPLFIDITRTALLGQFRTSKYNGDFRGSLRGGNNPFILTDFGPKVSPATQALITAAAERFRAGGSPFSGPLADRDGRPRVAADATPTAAEVDRMDYFVAGVIGDVPAP